MRLGIVHPEHRQFIWREIAKLRHWSITNKDTHLAGDGSFKKKKFKEFCQIRFNLLIKISHIPDFENF